MEYRNFDLEITSRQGGGYPVAARSEAGEARHLMRLPWEGAALENVLLQVENALLRAGHISRGAGTSEEQVVQRFGQTLFEALLGEDVRRLYDRSAWSMNQQGHGLRVRLRIQAPELATLPWEFLYDPLKREYLCFLPDTVVVRYLEVAQPIQPFQIVPPLRVLAMISDPTDQDRLDVIRERQRLIAALGPLEQRGLVKLEWVEGQTAPALHHALLQREWHIFHYIGHGGFDPRIQEGVIALVNEHGSSYLLSATDLGRLLERRHSLRLVVLNSCQGAAGNKHDLFSSTAATLASKGLPAVLAMQYDISDQAALEFTRGFYEALAVGIPVDEAVTEARTAIRVGAAKTLEWVTPVLYLRSPTGRLFLVPRRDSAAIQLPHQIDSAVSPKTEPAQKTSLQPPPAPDQPGPAPRLLSRRTVTVGLVGLAAAGGGIAWVVKDLLTPPSRSALGTTLFSYRKHTLAVIALAWSPDGTRIASASADTTVQVWNVTNGNLAFSSLGHPSQVNAVAWFHNKIVSGGKGDARVWDATNGNHLFTYQGYASESEVDAVAWSLPDGKLIASGGSDHAVQIWMADNGTTSAPPYTHHTQDVFAVAWSPNGKYIASGSEDQTVQVCDATTEELIYTYAGHSKGVKALAWSPDSKRIASASADMTVQVWDATTGLHPLFYLRHTDAVRAVSWSPDGNYIVSAGTDQTVQIWAANSGSHLFTYKGHTDQVNTVGWSPDGTRVASGGKDKIVQVWQAG